MAEAFGIAAGALQFADVGSRILLSLSRLYSDISHVPEKIAKGQSQVEDLVLLVEAVPQDLAAPNTAPGSSLSAVVARSRVDRLVVLIRETIRELHELQVILDDLSAKKSDNVYKRSWKAVVSLKKD